MRVMRGRGCWNTWRGWDVASVRGILGVVVELERWLLEYLA